MGLIARESTAPIVSGEVTSGTEIENEFNKVFTLVGLSSGSEGNVDDANISATANINGTKLNDSSVATVKIEDGSIPGSKISDGVLTTAKFTAASVTQPYVDTDTGTEAATTSFSFVDVPGITAWTVAPGSTLNYIMLELICSITASVQSRLYGFGFSVNGVDTADVAWLNITSTMADFHTINASWSTITPRSESIIIKPRYRLILALGSDTNAFEEIKVFSGLIVPVK